MAQDKHADNKYYEQIRTIGTEAVESDQAGTGNSTLTTTNPVAFIDIFNGGSSNLSISAGGVTRLVPAGSASLCEFPSLETSFVINADGAWIARPCK